MVSPHREEPRESSFFYRYELKYRVPVERLETIRGAVRPHVTLDRYCERRPSRRYTVRSIYFDTKDFRFYYEKVFGVKTRKKLRLRTYNLRDEETHGFLEIKRKIDRRTHKERLRLPMAAAGDFVFGKEASRAIGARSPSEKRVRDRFRFNLTALQLRPTVLVTYDREAWVGIENPEDRVTFDMNIRSYLYPSLEQIFDERTLKPIERRYAIVELKFNETMPPWMRSAVSSLKLRSQPYSKFCNGIDAWEAASD